MDFDFNLNKIKNIPRFLAQKSFWTTLVLIGTAVLIGLLLGYKYVYLVKQTSPETSTLTKLNESKIEKVLDRLDQRKKKFNEVKRAPYNLFEAD